MNKTEELIGIFGTLCDYMVDNGRCDVFCPYAKTKDKDDECEAWRTVQKIRQREAKPIQKTHKQQRKNQKIRTEQIHDNKVSIDKYVPLDYNTHTVRITFNWCGAVGHISYVLKGNCKGADILESALDFISDCDMNDIENLVENDCHLAMSGNDDPIFCLHLHKDKNNDVMLSELDAKEVEELIVAVEIVDCKGEIEIEDV